MTCLSSMSGICSEWYMHEGDERTVIWDRTKVTIRVPWIQAHIMLLEQCAMIMILYRLGKKMLRLYIVQL